MLITDQKALDDYCLNIKAPYITIDTEFLRDKTYYPKLCLIQISGPEIEPAAIDPLANRMDLTPVIALLENPAITKVFHSGRQDLEIFYTVMSGKLPSPIFDTQVAASVLGYGDQVSYAVLVKQICGADIDKSNQFTDWARRPLSEKQLSYALSDVTYLREIYERLLKDLDKTGRARWTAEEMERLQNTDGFDIDAKDAWKRIKIRSKKKQDLVTLQALAAWRETMAQEKDIPRGRILKDEILAQLAMLKPTSENDLKSVRGLPEGYRKGYQAERILKMIAQAKQNWKSSTIEIPQARKKPDTDISAAMDMLKLLLKIKASEAGIAPKMLATVSDLEDIALGLGDNLAIMKGWRYEIFGQYAQDLLKGRISLSLQGQSVKIDKAK